VRARAAARRRGIASAKRLIDNANRKVDAAFTTSCETCAVHVVAAHARDGDVTHLAS